MASATGAESTKKCPVCHDILKDPQILACDHKLCSHCLQQHISATATAENKFNCPSCRQECEVPEGVEEDKKTVVEQPTNDGQLNELLGASAAMCTNSDHGPATVFCSDCYEFYCQSCASGHTAFKLTRDHSMKPVDKISPGQIPAMTDCDICPEHEQQKLNMVCKRCKTLICKTCVMPGHKDHWCQELLDAANEAKKELEYLVSEAQKYINQQDDKLKDTKQIKEDIIASMESARKAVKEAAQQIRDIINHHENDLLLDIAHHETETLAELASLNKDIEKNKASAILLKKETETLCQFGRTLDQVVKASRIHKQLAVKRKSQHQNMSWKFGIGFNQQTDYPLLRMLGNVKLQLSPTVTSCDKINLGEHFLQIPLKCGEHQQITGMVVLDDCLCVTNEDNLQLYDLISGHNQTCQVQGLYHPQGLALVKSPLRTVVIADGRSDSNLHFVKMSTDHEISHHRVKSIPLSKPSKITVSTETGELLIGDKDKPQFVICDEDGDVQKQVTLHDLPTSKDYYSKSPGCYCITRTTNGYAAIVRNKDKEVFIQRVNQDGKRGYGRQSEESIGDRSHMIKDSNGRLIVADHNNHRLHLLDTGGYCLQFLLTEDDGIHNPQCVFLDETSSRLYVAHGKEGSLEVRSYRWPLKSGDVKTINFNLKLNVGQF